MNPLIRCSLTIPTLNLSDVVAQAAKVLGYAPREVREDQPLGRVLAVQNVQPFTLATVAGEKQERLQKARRKYKREFWNYKLPRTELTTHVSIALLAIGIVVLLALVIPSELVASPFFALSTMCGATLIMLWWAYGCYVLCIPQWRCSAITEVVSRIPERILECTLQLAEQCPTARFEVEYLGTATFLKISGTWYGRTTTYYIDFWDGADEAASTK